MIQKKFKESDTNYIRKSALLTIQVMLWLISYAESMALRPGLECIVQREVQADISHSWRQGREGTLLLGIR